MKNESMKKYNLNESFTVVADLWKETSMIWDDSKLSKYIKASSIREQHSYIAEYLGVLQSFDRIFLRHNIKEIRYPATFYDHFKAKFYPNWLLNKFPAKYIVFDISAVLPRLEYNLDESDELLKDLSKIPKEDKIILITQTNNEV